MKITIEWLKEHGYEYSQVFGFRKEVGDTTFFVGHFPRNEDCVSVRFGEGDVTVCTNAETTDDIEHLERLLGGAFIDHDDFEYVDAEEESPS